MQKYEFILRYARIIGKIFDQDKSIISIFSYELFKYSIMLIS